MHYAGNAGSTTCPEQFIANQHTGGTAAMGVPDQDAVSCVQLTAQPDGSFTVKNYQNGYYKDYTPKR